MLTAAAAFTLLSLASSVLAAPSPLTPVTANEGSTCIISWIPDTTGDWTETNIELMTGDNLKMIHLTTITTVDATAAGASSYEWDCPDVDKNSGIYFYQYSTAKNPADLQWSTRFAIADSDGKVTTPEFATQPDAAKSAIPWGIGALEDQSDATPAPSYITGQTSSTGSVTPSGISSVSGSSSGSVSATGTASANSRLTTTTVSSSHSTTKVSSSSVSGTAAAQATNGAITHSQGSLLAVALGAVATAFFALA